MTQSVSEITIERPIEDVFAVLTDVEKTGLWFPGDVNEHWTTPPPHGVGSIRHAVVTMGGRTQENDAIVVEYDPPRRAVMKGMSSNAPFVAALDFSPAGAGTHVVVTTDLNLRGPLRLLGSMITSVYGGMWSRGLQNLKRMMESGEL